MTAALADSEPGRDGGGDTERETRGGDTKREIRGIADQHDLALMRLDVAEASNTHLLPNSSATRPERAIPHPSLIALNN